MKTENAKYIKAIADLKVMLDLGDEICAEARPNYEDSDNEIYTIVDWNINSNKLRKHYEKEMKALAGAKTFEEALKRLKETT